MTCTWLEGKSLRYLLLGLLVKVRVPGKLGAGVCPGGTVWPGCIRNCLSQQCKWADLGSGSADSALRNRREGSNFCKFSKKVLKSNCWKWLGKLTDYNQHRDFFPAHRQCQSSLTALSTALVQPRNDCKPHLLKTTENDRELHLLTDWSPCKEQRRPDPTPTRST